MTTKKQTQSTTSDAKAVVTKMAQSPVVPIVDFLNRDFREFSIYDCVTNIPSLVDGLKVAQRKIIWTVINNPKTITVEQLAALSAAYTKYHHGATSLEDAIVGMAQNFTGTNNVPWLVADGEFGNIMSPKASSPRYISTTLHANWKKWYAPDDNHITEYVMEDGEVTEPKYFLPIVPTLLLNGSHGVATGFKSLVFTYNPKEVVQACIDVLQDKPVSVPLIPYYEGYRGIIERNGRQTIWHGAFEKSSATTITITQLPIGVDPAEYKETVLNPLVMSGEIKRVDDDTEETGWKITLHSTREWCKLHPEILMEKLKLKSRNTETFTCWDEKGKIRRFDGPAALIHHFVAWRVGKYEERRQKLIEIHSKDAEVAEEKAKFIDYFVNNSQLLTSMNKQAMEQHLTGLGYVNVSSLMQIRIYNLTQDEIDKLKKEIAGTLEKIEKLKSTTAHAMYLKELKSLL